MSSRTMCPQRGVLAILVVLSIAWSWPSGIARASHVVGGNLELVALDKTPGRYRVALNLYFDEINQNVGGAPENSYPILIYRKSDNKQVGVIPIVYVSNQPIVYTNQTCATQRKIKTTLYRYERVVNWLPADYADPGGYYIVWQSCCRNADIDNIVDAGRAGQSFYLAFPPLIRDGSPFLNSSPVFDQVDGEYLCVREPFSFAFDARDADGDQLRYSLQTPYDRLDQTVGTDRTAGSTVSWLPGFSATAAIPGSPPLTIDRQTGELRVTPNTIGLYVFTVLVEEYRNGQLIGAVRRDYQLFVVDCPPVEPPVATILYKNQPATAITVCEGKPVELTVATNAGWSYQWLKDGKPIVGATSATLSVTASGAYALITSLKAQCSKSRRTAQVKVDVTTARFTLGIKGPARLCGPTGSLSLSALSSANYSYQWYRDGSLLPTTTASTLTVTAPGVYSAVVRDQVEGCTAFSEVTSVSVTALPTATITPQRATTVICADDNLRLDAPQQAGYTYAWQQDGRVIPTSSLATYLATTAGGYAVVVTEPSGCTALSALFSLTTAQPIAVSLAAMPTFCVSQTATHSLDGQPLGGLFNGPGVSDIRFSPQQAGAGLHTIRYTIASSLTCQSGVASQLVQVRALPVVSLGPDRQVVRDGSVSLTSGLSASLTHQWSPAQGLSNPTAATTIATPTEPTRYSLIVTDSFGCTGQGSILVNLYDRLFIPTAFTPNGDGLNDRWELAGIQAYPQAEVTIFNRWGTVIYQSIGYSTPFEGRQGNEFLPTGVYTYQIKLTPEEQAVAGRLVLLK